MRLVTFVKYNVNDVCFEDLISFYNDDLLLRWKATLATAIQQCDKDFFPDIYALLHLGCTVPVNIRTHRDRPLFVYAKNSDM